MDHMGLNGRMLGKMEVSHNLSFFVEIKETDECDGSNEPEVWDYFTMHLSDVSII